MRPRKYDWEDWFSRRRFVLKRGDQYEIGDEGMEQQVRNAASARGLSVTVLVGEGQVTVLVNPKVTQAAGG